MLNTSIYLFPKKKKLVHIDKTIDILCEHDWLFTNEIISLNFSQGENTHLVPETTIKITDKNLPKAHKNLLSQGKSIGFGYGMTQIYYGLDDFSPSISFGCHAENFVLWSRNKRKVFLA
jgi:hypothetical protein